jgi:hypothetical protein
MDRSDATGIAGVIIGAGVSMSALMMPWDIPLFMRHVLFWTGLFVALGGGMWLAHVHYLNRRIPWQRWGVHASLVLLLVVIAVAVERPRSRQPVLQLDVFWTERRRYPAISIPFKEGLRKGIKTIMKSTPPAVLKQLFSRDYLGPNQASIMDSIIVRNNGKRAIKEVTVRIMCQNLRIRGETPGAKVFDQHQIYYDHVELRPYSEMGAENFFSISLITPEIINEAAIQIDITGDDIEPMMFMFDVTYLKNVSTIVPIFPNGPRTTE